MLSLRTLGTGVVIGDSGEQLGAAASQRRIVALLAVLAVAGDAGLSRDKLVGLLWPESTEGRARHSLTQALYSARLALNCDALFHVSSDIRLNETHITSDVRAFQNAIYAGDLARAVELYHGPFLDGFFLSGAPEFEDWVFRQRERYEALAAASIEKLAAEAEALGRRRSAVEAWRRLAHIRPLDSGIAIRLMEALAAIGDRAGALRHAELHEERLRQELEIAPDRAVVELADRLREQTSSGVEELSQRRGVVNLATSSAAPPTATSSTTVEEKSPSAVAPALARSRSRLRRWAIIPVLSALVVGFAVTVAWPHITRSVPVVTPAQQVVVAPFRVVGADASLGYLRDGLVELLSTRLADDSSARTVDAGATLAAWREAGLPADAEVPRAGAVDLASRLGAERVVVGSVIGTPARLIIRATVLRVPSGAAAAEASVDGPADSLSTLVDRLAGRLLLAQAGEDETLASRTTHLSALRAYLAGQAAFRAGDFTTSVREYETAVARDPDFALAALRLAIADDRLNDYSGCARALVTAWNARDQLTARDRALLVALAGIRYPTPSTASEQLGAWQHLAELSPTTSETWEMIGARLFHDGPAIDVGGVADRTRTALLRALASDMDNATAGRLLVQLGARAASRSSIDSIAMAAAVRDSLNLFAPYARWRIAVATRDSLARRRLRKQFDDFGTANLRMIAMTSQFDVVALEDGAAALAALERHDKGERRLVDLTLGEHSLALNSGRTGDALRATSRLRAIQPGSHSYLRLRVLDALYGDGDSSAAIKALHELESLTRDGAASAPATSSSWLADRCVVGQWRLAHGETSGVQQLIQDLRAKSSGFQPLPVATTPAACAELLDVSLAVLSKRQDARSRLAHLDSTVFSPQTSGDAVAYAPLLIARLHAGLGDVSGALQAIQRRTYMSGWPRYLSSVMRAEGQWASIAGNTKIAHRAYGRFIALRTDADSGLRPEVEEIITRDKQLQPNVQTR